MRPSSRRRFYRDFGYGLVYPQLLPHHRRRSDEAHAGAIEWGRHGAQHWLTVLDERWLGAAYPNVDRWLSRMKALHSWSATHESFDGFAAANRNKVFVTA